MIRHIILGILCVSISTSLRAQSSSLSLSNDDYGKNFELNSVFNCNQQLRKDSIKLDDIQEKALLMRWAKWTPKHAIPNNAGSFSSGKTITGLPYSSVKEMQKFIGLDVSIYTFLTAVNNPYNLINSEYYTDGNKCYLVRIYIR